MVYDQDNDKIRKGKLVAKWFGPLVVKTMLKRGAYELFNYDGEPLSEIKKRSLSEEILCIRIEAS